MRPVTPADLPEALNVLKVGDSVAVRAPDGWHEKLKVIAVTESGLVTESAEGERLTFARSDVHELKTRVRAPGRTIGLVLGILWLYPGIPGASLCTARDGC
mgnify:FL=1